MLQSCRQEEGGAPLAAKDEEEEAQDPGCCPLALSPVGVLGHSNGTGQGPC